MSRNLNLTIGRKLATKQVAEEQLLNSLEPKAWLTC